MINFGPKSKVSKKPKAKKTRKVSTRIPRRPVGYFALTPEDIAEMNLFSAAAAVMNARGAKRRLAEAIAKVKVKA